MSVLVEREVFIPAQTAALAYSVDAGRTLEPGGPSWTVVLAIAGQVAMGLYQQLGHEVTVSACPQDTLSGEGPRLVLLFHWSAPIHEADVDACNALIDATDLPWRPEGTRHVPPQAVAIVAVADSELWLLWHVRDGQTVCCSFGLDSERDVISVSVSALNAISSRFPVGPGHALAVSTDPEASESASLIEMMKVAWMLDIAERLIEADGYAHPDELTVLQRTFPPRRLEALGLLDRAACVRLRCLARVELASLVPADDKRALLVLLYRIACVDGSISDSELAVLRVAAEQLAVDWSDAQSTMLEQWP